MAVTLTGTGGLLTRTGKLVKWARNVNGFRGATAPNPSSAWGSGGATINDPETAFAAIFAQYQATNDDENLVSGLPAQLANLRSSVSGQMTAMQQLANSTLIFQVNADSPLSSQNTLSALQVLIAQMKASSSYVAGNTVTATASAGGSNVGNPTLSASVIGANGVNLQYPFPEVMSMTVTTDATRGATAGNESLSISGTIANSDPLNYTWPDGSGISGVALTVIDFSKDNAGGNLLTNSGFELFVTTADLPDQWTRLVGVLGTDINEGATARSGTKSLQFLGDGATLSSVSQVFDNNTTGTAGALSAPPVGPQSAAVATGVYAFSGWVRVDDVPAAGVLKIDLINGSGTVINDDAGTPNSITSTLTGLTADTWTNVKGYFRLPTVPPATISIRVHLTTALTDTVSVFMDDFALGVPTQLYVGGPFLAVFRGTTDVTINDTWTLTVANNLGHPTSPGGLHTEWFERFFGMRALGITLPISGSTQIAENLCT